MFFFFAMQRYGFFCLKPNILCLFCSFSSTFSFFLLFSDNYLSVLNKTTTFAHSKLYVQLINCVYYVYL